MQIRNIFMHVISLMFASSFAYAACPTSSTQAFTYTDLSQCRSCYATKEISGGSTDKKAADRYCALITKSYITAIEFCVQQKSLDQVPPFTTATEIDNVRQICTSLVNPTTTTTTTVTTASTGATDATTYAQSAASAQAAAGTATAQAAAAAAAAAAAGTTTTSSDSTSSSNTAAIAAALKAAPTIISGLEKSRSKEKTTSENGGTPEGSVGETTDSANGSGNVSQNHRRVATATGSSDDDSSVQSNNDASAADTQTENNGTLTPEQVTAAKAACNGDESCIRGVDEAQRATAQGGNVQVPGGGPIEAATEQSNATLETLNTRVQAASGKVTAGTCFNATGGKLGTFASALKTYIASKKSCASLAKKAEFLCVEGTSPGAKAAHLVMDAAGPILAVVGSAQKACSNTSKFTSLASTVLLAAKGVCVAAKVACDGSCSTAKKALDALKGSSTEMRTTFTTELQACEAQAAASLGTSSATVEMSTDVPQSQVQLADIQAALQKETVPNLGTPSGLIAKCESKATDIAGMVVNIGSLLLAKKSADDCAEKLATTSSASGDVTTAQYCEIAANASSQFCKCQANSQQEGCPGYVATATSSDTAAEVAGTNIRNSSGLSGFATGTGTEAKPGAVDMSGLTGSDSGSGQVSALGAGSTGSTPFGAVGSSAGGSNNGDNAALAKGKASGDSSKKGDDSGKWSFGSFANSLFGGGSKNSNASNGDDKNKADVQAAVERKIASEKISGQITSASGKSNWEKIRQSYQIKESSFLVGQ